jgi:serine/threonine protein kinase/tetratricopeptide (TPR) repeat protein
MTPELWQRVQALLDEALQAEPSARSAYLDQACSGEPSLRREVESLIAAHENAADFMERPAEESFADLCESDPASRAGERIGHYRLLEEIGRGGMAAVYRAVRVDDFEQQVAVKLVKRGLDTEFVLARFRSERQILARLEHPNIARLIDGASTKDGVPYFVMEYVRGGPLDEYCDSHRLTITGRLRIFLEVCSAVQYAHRNLVVHRDIKPSNILVTDADVPKLLDFGIAKILNPDSPSSGKSQTRTVVKLLTPEYASPEQLLGEPITTASDVYSLGILLYELLTGHRPYRAADRSPEAMGRALSENEPERPSSAVAHVEEVRDRTGVILERVTPEQVAANREVSVEKLRRQLAGDIDNVVLMAIRREPQRRYGSVEQFSEDIQRHLDGQPVLARTDTFWYRGSKFGQRHRAAVAAGALVALALLIGMAATLREARIARLERGRAEQRFNDVRKLANSLIFDIHDSIQILPGSTAARKLIVEKALQYLDSLAHESRGDVSLQRELADAYERVGDVQGKPQAASLGDTVGALASYQKAQTIRAMIAGTGTVADRVKYAANSRVMANLRFYHSDAANALRSAQQAVAITEALLKDNPADPQVLRELAADYSSLGDLTAATGAASGLRGAEVERLYEKALAIDQRLAAGSQDPAQQRRVEADELFIGRHLREAGYRPEAIQAFRKALTIGEERAADPNNAQAQRDLASAHINLGDVLMMSGQTALALANYRKGLEIMRALAKVDPNNGDARLTIGEGTLNVGTALFKLGKFQEALSDLDQAIAIFEKGLAADLRQEGANFDLMLAHVWRASLLAALSDPAAPLEDYRKALAIDQRLTQIDPGNWDWRETMAGIRAKMGDFFRRQRQWGSAQENYRQAIGAAREILNADASKQEPHYVLGAACFGMGELCSLRALRKSEGLERQVHDWNEAKLWYQQSSEAWSQIRSPGAVSEEGFDWGSPANATRSVARCEAAISRLKELAAR